jgi:DNA-binding transcriptional MerR regulator
MAKKVYFRIGEVAEKFNVRPSLIRYWEKEFSFIRPKKSPKGTRLFTQKDVDHFEIVYHLIKEKGMTIQGTREYFNKHYDKASMDKLQVINTLKRTKALLQEVKSVLEEAGKGAGFDVKS